MSNNRLNPLQSSVIFPTCFSHNLPIIRITHHLVPTFYSSNHPLTFLTFVACLPRIHEPLITSDWQLPEQFTRLMGCKQNPRPPSRPFFGQKRERGGEAGRGQGKHFGQESCFLASSPRPWRLVPPFRRVITNQTILTKRTSNRHQITPTTVLVCWLKEPL